jgi:hypothetical protein
MVHNSTGQGELTTKAAAVVAAAFARCYQFTSAPI